jgi:hypothetical protein
MGLAGYQIQEHQSHPLHISTTIRHECIRGGHLHDNHGEVLNVWLEDSLSPAIETILVAQGASEAMNIAMEKPVDVGSGEHDASTRRVRNNNDCVSVRQKR